MILTLLCIITTLLGIILILIGSNICNDDIGIIGIMIEVFSLFFLITSLAIIISSYATANMNIQKNKIEYEGLCKRYEIVKSEYEDVSKSDVIADITAWNAEVFNTKYWTENPWTNWFNSKKVADNLYYIPLEEGKDE